MSMDKIKLFETVLKFHERGNVELTASEKSLIETETRDLLSAASRKQAGMAPEGFESLLMSLKNAGNPDEAYEMVVSFLEQQSDPGCPGPGNGLGPGKGPGLGMGLGLGGPGPDKGLGLGSELGGGPDKGPMPVMPMGDSGPMDDMPKLLKPDSGMGGGMGSPLDKPDFGSDSKPEKSEDDEDEKKEDKGSKPFPPKAKPEDGKSEEKKEDSGSLKDKILAKSKELNKAAQDGGDGDSSIGEPVDGTDELPWKKKKDKKDDKEDNKDKKDKDDKKAMSLKDPRTASKVKVRVTSSRNILASFDGKPLFHAVPNDAVKGDLNELKRLANKVFGWVVYEGAKTAAKKCGVRLLAGVDDDIVTNFDEPVDAPASAGVLEDAEGVTQDSLASPDSEVTGGAEFDTQDTPDKVSAGVNDGGEVVTSDKPSPKPSAVVDGNSTVHQDVLGTPAKDVRDDADVDYQSVKASLTKLYASKADKKIKAANAKFVEKFISCMKIASTRMLINQDDSPYKEASFDVLTDDRIIFGDGAVFTGLKQSDAAELTEHIAACGHADFVDQLFERTADLMNKSEEYLSDLSSDLDNLSVKPVDLKIARTASRVSAKSEELKKEASAGNFILNTENIGTQVTGSSTSNTVDGVRAAVGGTLLSRRASTLEQLTDCQTDNHSKEL